MGYMTIRDAETALALWEIERRAQLAARDKLVRDALAAGVSKQRVHVLTGIARTTIDRIIIKGES